MFAVDLSVHVPCGRVMAVFTPILQKARPGRTVSHLASLSFEGSEAQWLCKASKKIRQFEDAEIFKYQGA